MDMQKQMVDHLVGQVIEYCMEYQIQHSLKLDDRGVKFTFQSDIIAHKVKAYVNSRFIVRDGSQLFIARDIYDDSPEVDLIPKIQKIRHIMIAVLLMISLYILFFLWIWD
jgi:hypothetical protein